MSSNNWWFLYQQKGGEDDWKLAQADQRQQIVSNQAPAFVTVLDLNSIPDDHDWSKVRYRGPLYFDFDADGDLPLVCEKFKAFLGKLHTEWEFDLEQARFYASGGKGFHIEIPEECIHPKLPKNGTAWLPYVYRSIAEAMVVDTMDMLVYTGKRGRMWRTPGVKRDNGNYKVQLRLEELLEMTPEMYLDVISKPRQAVVPNPPSCNLKLALAFDRAKDKVTAAMRNKKSKSAKANALLDPWRKAGKIPPTISGIMDGTIVHEGARFQNLAMQLSIFATSVGMELAAFLKNCEGLCHSHVSDSGRYGTFQKRQEELARMYRYMESDSLYEFDPAPLARLVKKGISTTDLGVMDTEDKEDVPKAMAATEPPKPSEAAAAATPMPVIDVHSRVRRGVFMNGDGIFIRRGGDDVESLCRVTMRGVEAYYSVATRDFAGYEADLVVGGRKLGRKMMTADLFTSAGKLRSYLALHQLTYQGGEAETSALLDIMADKASRGGEVFIYPREGFFIIDNPLIQDKPTPTMVYLTQTGCVMALKEDDPNFFQLRYRPEQALSSYKIDIHKAPDLDKSMIGALHDLFSFTREDIAADLIGWMVACHYRSVYLRLFNQFPLLQVFGEAGSGKSQTIWMLAHLHWFLVEPSMKSASGSTNFALDMHASTSTSAPLILDEYKPREMRVIKGRYEKVKDLLKASYIAGDVGERGTLNKASDSPLSVIKSKATAPIVFLAESIEMETAIFERSVTVQFSQSHQTRHRAAAFHRLHDEEHHVLSALGKAIVQAGFQLNLDTMRQDVMAIQRSLSDALPDQEDDSRKRPAERLSYNKAVIIHGLKVLQRVLHAHFGDEFDRAVDCLIQTKLKDVSGDESDMIKTMGMSELSKVLTKMATLSRAQDQPWEFKPGQDYWLGEGYLDLKLEQSFDKYKRYCVAHAETPLFDTFPAFMQAFAAYPPVLDRNSIGSSLRDDGDTAHIPRMSLRKLNREGVGSFRG